MKFVREIDSNGLFVSDAIISDEDKSLKKYVEEKVPEGLTYPKWNGYKWIESGIKIDKE